MDKSMEFTRLLEQKKIRPSHQRLRILQYLYLNHTHPTVEEIYTALKPKMPTLTKATIYNTLKVFVEKQLVVEVHIEENEVRYEPFADPHGHFKCKQCGSIYDFDLAMEDISGKGLDDFLIETKNVYFKGICPKCLAKSSAKNKEVYL